MLYIILVFIIICLLMILIALYSKYNYIKYELKECNDSFSNIDILNNFDNYLTIMKYFVELAYDVIYQQEILTYVASGYLIDEEKNIEINKLFITTFKELMGNNLLKFYSKIYGSEEIFINNILLIFNELLIENDLKTTIENEVK